MRYYRVTIGAKIYEVEAENPQEAVEKAKKRAGNIKPGAGRPPAHPTMKKNFMPIKLPQWLINWLTAQDKARSVLIENAVIKYYHLKPPKI